MITVLIGCLLLGVLIYVGLGLFAPRVTIASRVVIAAGTSLLMAGLAGIWIYYAAHQMPADATIVEPAPSRDSSPKR